MMEYDDYRDMLVTLAHTRNLIQRQQDQVTQSRLHAQLTAIRKAGSYKDLGSNETERSLVLEHAILTDTVYQEAVQTLRDLQREADVLDASTAAMRFRQRQQDIDLRRRVYQEESHATPDA